MAVLFRNGTKKTGAFALPFEQRFMCAALLAGVLDPLAFSSNSMSVQGLQSQKRKSRARKSPFCLSKLSQKQNARQILLLLSI